MTKVTLVGKSNTSISSPFDSSLRPTEPEKVAVLMHWMRNIIEEKNIDLGLPDVEAKTSEGLRPDVVIYESRRSQNVICVIEAKRPYFDVFDEALKDDARKKANKLKAKYFATTNFKMLIWWKTEEANKPDVSEEKQIVEKYSLSDIEELDDIEQTKYSEPTKRGLSAFLTKLYAVYYNKEPEPKQAVDEFLVLRLHGKIETLTKHYKSIIEDRCHKDSEFALKLKKWFRKQGWSFNWQPQDFDKAARQTAYLLVNKILFYNVLQAKRPKELDPLEIPQGLTKGAMLQVTLQGYFTQVLKIDYETVYTADFIDNTAFPDLEEVVEEIKRLVYALGQYDFSKLGDIIGRIFERLIPQEERHNLGQYFTRTDVVDLILKFCLHNEDDKVLDPSCGAGTFLVRAYHHKKLMNQRKTHEELLDKLWGNDIAKFPATLSTINLAIRDLAVEKNYPNIIQEDFFALTVGEQGFDLENWRKRRAKTLGVKEREVIYPRWFNVIVGNPPYTRQEEISEISPDDVEYKEKLIKNALLDLKGKKIADIGKRAGIHSYFFVHGTKFLLDGGFFGFIVSSSWLDVDYGKGLQELFLKNYKIITIIESKCERWFEGADINTCIIILQKCTRSGSARSPDLAKKERDNNLVRFVYLKKPLGCFIPPAQDIWEEEVKRLDTINKLKKTILGHNEFYENDELRIFPISQKELWTEGFDSEGSVGSPDPTKKGKYTGAKWGKYLRAPEIFFKILVKCKDKLVPLKEIADVRRGFTTGANEFFYLTEEEIKRRKIEEEFWMHKDEKGNWVPNYVIKSPRECKSIIVKPEDLKYRVLMIHKDKKKLKNTNILKYIEQGERKGFDKRPTCKSRKRWYDLGKWKPFNIIWPQLFNDSFRIFINKNYVYSDCVLMDVNVKNNILIASGLNCSYIPIFIELFGRVSLGEGALKLQVEEMFKFPIINPDKISQLQTSKTEKVFNRLCQRKVKSVFEELGAFSPDEVSLDKVKPDRRELDKIIMGEILGLTDEEQLEVYRAVIDLVKSRIDKAKSVDKKGKIIDGIDMDSLKHTIAEQIKKANQF